MERLYTAIPSKMQKFINKLVDKINELEDRISVFEKANSFKEAKEKIDNPDTEEK